MISKENFVSVIDAIEQFLREEDRLYHETNGVLRLYENDAINDMVSSFFCFLLKLFNDENDWIGYYMYELDFGKGWTETSVVEEDGSVIYLRNAGELYDFLIKNIESKTNSDKVIENGN